MPDVGDLALLRLEHDDLGVVVVELREERVELDLAEAPAELAVRVGREVLVGEEDDVVLEEQAVELGEAGVVDGAEVEAPELGAEGAGEAADVDGTGDRHPTI